MTEESGQEAASDDGDKRLRYGWTTGACAAAAAKSGCSALWGAGFLNPVQITLPKGQTPSFALAEHKIANDAAMAAIEKDAGDDPDVTHGAIIRASVCLGKKGSGISFHAGEGVGTVTKPGLPLAVGEPAINPAPRALITGEIEKLAAEMQQRSDIAVTISVDNGAALAEKTWNPRLGILGGISILGTTGIVVPYSCSAWIHSIHRGIDVARALNSEHVAACTGSTSEKAIQAHYQLPDHALLDMGDFTGAVLKYLRQHPVPKLTLGGGFGKLSKLANGAMDLHSKRSQVDLNFLAEIAIGLGATDDLAKAISSSNTAMEAQSLAAEAGVELAQAVAEKARDTALTAADRLIEIEVIVVDRAGAVIAHAPFAS